jgi:hypothetical protein
MAATEPRSELDARFSDPDATATPWEDGRRALERAELYWISTVRHDGRPHVTPLIGLWLESALWFTTGPTEQKFRNLQGNRHCVLTTGCNRWAEGLDVVVEGEAVRETDDARLGQVANALVAKYGEVWRFEVRDGAFHQAGGEAHVFRVEPDKVLGFAKAPHAHTRWRFAPR